MEKLKGEFDNDTQYSGDRVRVVSSRVRRPARCDVDRAASGISTARGYIGPVT